MKNKKEIHYNSLHVASNYNPELKNVKVVVSDYYNNEIIHKFDLPVTSFTKHGIPIDGVVESRLKRDVNITVSNYSVSHFKG